ncbi:NAD-dependent epimerase/dehydratase family protein [soil metagenome]
MKVFVTGGTGFIGRHLCHALHQQGHQVVALIRSPKKASVLPEGTELLKGDMASFKDPNFVIPPCDVVIHLAGVIAGKNEQDYITTNFQSVVDFMECLQRQTWKPERFVFASSLAAGGPCLRDNPISESMPDKPIEPYGISKWQADEYLKALDIPTISFRPTIVLGPEDAASFTLYQMANKGIGMRPSGKPQQVSIVYVEDLVDAIILMAQMDMKGSKHKTYYVSSPGLHTTVDLFQAIGKALGKKISIVVVPRFVLKSLSIAMTNIAKVIPFTNQLDDKQYKQMTVDSFACSGQLLQDELGWQPKHTLLESTQKSVDGYRKAGWL